MGPPLKQEVGNPPAVLDWVPDVRPTVTLDAAKEIGKAEALWIGSTAGSTGEVILPSTGQYTLQVYQMRNTARRGKSVNFKVDIQILNQVP